VKELERAGLITTEQRGLRRTNVYLFIFVHLDARTREIGQFGCGRIRRSR
jgi:hypothetical protein